MANSGSSELERMDFLLHSGFWLAAIMDILQNEGLKENKAWEIKDKIEKRAKERFCIGRNIRIKEKEKKS
jgi:hypothetical protein